VRRGYFFVLGFTAFFLIGTIQAVIGPLLPVLQRHYQLGAADLSTLVVLRFVAEMAGSYLGGLLISRSFRPMLVASGLLQVVGLLTISALGPWGWVLVGALLAGIGYGGFSTGFNVMASQVEGHSVAALNLVNALFGAGSVAGPLLLVLWPGAGPTGIFAALGLTCLLLTAALAVWPAPTPRLRGSAPGSGAGTFRFGPLALFVAALFVYVGCETGPGTWEASLLAPRLGLSQAALMTSLFWAALTVGRLVAAALPRRIHPGKLVLWASLLAAAALALALDLNLAPTAYVLTGLALAPIFPTTLAWFTRSLPSQQHQVSLLLALGSLGGAVLPGAVGLLVQAGGLSMIPVGLLGSGLLLVAVVAVTLAFAGRITPAIPLRSPPR
jgi:fucose permease